MTDSRPIGCLVRQLGSVMAGELRRCECKPEDRRGCEEICGAEIAEYRDKKGYPMIGRYVHERPTLYAIEQEKHEQRAREGRADPLSDFMRTLLRNQ